MPFFSYASHLSLPLHYMFFLHGLSSSYSVIKWAKTLNISIFFPLLNYPSFHALSAVVTKSNCMERIHGNNENWDVFLFVLLTFTSLHFLCLAPLLTFSPFHNYYCESYLYHLILYLLLITKPLFPMNIMNTDFLFSFE